MKLVDVAVQWAPALVIGALIFGYEEFIKKGPVVPDPPLAAAAKTYVKTLPEAYASAAAQVKNGILADKKTLIGSLQAHAKPLADALDNAFTPSHAEPVNKMPGGWGGPGWMRVQQNRAFGPPQPLSMSLIEVSLIEADLFFFLRLFLFRL